MYAPGRVICQCTPFAEKGYTVNCEYVGHEGDCPMHVELRKERGAVTPPPIPFVPDYFPVF